MTDSIIESPRAAEARAERRAAHGANQRPSRRRKAVVAGVVAGAVGVGGSLTGAFLHDQARIEANTIAKRSVSITVDGDVAIALDGLPGAHNERAYTVRNTGSVDVFLAVSTDISAGQDLADLTLWDLTVGAESYDDVALSAGTVQSGVIVPAGGDVTLGINVSIPEALTESDFVGLSATSDFDLVIDAVQADGNTVQPGYVAD